MATFKAIVRSHHKRKDDKYPVSIRLTHNRESVYLPTGLYVSKKQINSRCFELKDSFVIERTNETIRTFEKTLLSISTEELLGMTAKELALAVSVRHKDIDFIEFAENLMKEPSYKKDSLGTVLLILKNNMGCKTLMLKHIDEIFLERFRRVIDKIEIPASRKANETETKGYSTRTKNGFIVSFHVAYKRAIEQMDYDRRRKYIDAFGSVKLFKGGSKKVESVPVPLIRRFFNTKFDTPLQEMTKDMVIISFCLGGMNLGDILLAKKTDYDKTTNRITYRRNKIKGKRSDGGLTSVRVEPEIQELFDKYTSLSKDEFLFNFNGMRFTKDTSRNFGMTVNRMYKLKGLPHISPYQFRHSVGTIARNKCGFSKDDVGSLLNHKGLTTVDDAYIDVDWSINDRINRAVLDYVFHSDEE